MKSLLLKNADVWAPEPLGRADVLVLGGVIAGIGSFDAPAGWPVEVIDLQGAILAPGLIDAHTHITGGGGESGPETKVPAVPFSAFTTAGVTTVIGLLGTDCRTRGMAELLAGARALERLGLTALCYTGGYEVPPVTLTGSARGDLVHVDRIVGIGETAISDHRSSQPTYEEIVRLASDAHVGGLLTGKAGVLHLHLGDGERGLAYVRLALAETELPARVFHPTHLNRNARLWKEAMGLSPRGLTLDLTAFPPAPDEPDAADCIAEYLAAGHDPERLTMSSDGGGCLPVFDRDGVMTHMDVGASASLLATVRRARAAGVSFAAALATVTSNVARQFRLHDRGRIGVGLRADLVVLEPDLRVRTTLANGQVLVRDGVATARGAFEVPPPAN